MAYFIAVIWKILWKKNQIGFQISAYFCVFLSSPPSIYLCAVVHQIDNVSASLDNKTKILRNPGVNMSIIPLMNLQLSQNQEELERLKKSKQALLESKHALAEKEKRSLQPALSASTWEGQLAKQFQAVRKNELLESYNATEKQINSALQLLDEKISKLTTQNIQIEKAIQAEIVKMRKKEV